MVYNPGRLGDIKDVDELRGFLEDELNKISKEFNETLALDLRSTHREPNKPREGMLVSADGTNWDPGAGKGTYEYIDGVWQRVGGVQDGDYGDITVAGGNWTIDNNVVTNVKLADMVPGTVKGRYLDVVAGDPTDLGLQVFSNGRIQQQPAGFNLAHKNDIAARTDSGFFQTDTATFAEGWPLNTSAWCHLIASTHANDANYYSMQLAGDLFDPTSLYHRNTNNLGTRPWNRIYHTGFPPVLLVANNVFPAATGVTIANIPPCKIILVGVQGVSHNSGAVQFLQMSVSGNNGASFGAAFQMSIGTFSNAQSVSGLCAVLRADQASSFPILSSALTLTVGGVDNVTVGPINAIRLAMNGGSFDAGSYYVYALN